MDRNVRYVRTSFCLLVFTTGEATEKNTNTYIILPFTKAIPGGIEVGTEIIIKGRNLVPDKSFSINLCDGPRLAHDTPLHFNPRFDSDCVVRNHHQDLNWGPSERTGGMPFAKGRNFEMKMKVEADGYVIKIDGRFFCHFKHRLTIEKAQYIYIAGDVTIDSVEFLNLPPPRYTP